MGLLSRPKGKGIKLATLLIELICPLSRATMMLVILVFFQELKMTMVAFILLKFLKPFGRPLKPSLFLCFEL